ncbi:MAG: DUF3825 domain-containing protein [Adlercreutzia sp.]|nr:DUF3825 domain-containing protein [Adlercreutzia sp.]
MGILTHDSQHNGNLLDSEMELIKTTASSEKYRRNPVPTNLVEELSDTLLDFTDIPTFTERKLELLYNTSRDIREMVADDWATAFKCGAIRMHEDKAISFPTRVALASGEALEVSIAKSREGNQKPWYLSYVPEIDKMRLLRDSDGTCHTQGEGAEEEEPLPTVPEESFIAMKQTEDYLTGPVPVEILSEIQDLGATLSDYVWISQNWQEKIIDLAGSRIDPIALLNRDWRVARDHFALRYYDGKVLFPIGIIREDGETLVEVSIARDSHQTRPDSKPWRVSFVDSFPKHRQAAGKAIFEWAYLGNMDLLLSKLADMALEEAWSFDSGEDKGLPILRSYLTYTFFRLKGEGKILEDREKGIAAFNTGLVDNTYEPIYACFSPASMDQPWRFESFCKAASRGWGKKLVSAFNPLPERAKYFQRKEDLLFDSDKVIVHDSDHILLDNIERLPREFLEDELRSSPEALAYIEPAFSTENGEASAEAYDQIREMISNNARLKRCLINRLNDAIDVARKRVEWNFKTAVPAFYPTKNSMSLLLPLDLTNNDSPDVALVVELVESGAYIGQTILTMEMAYNNARLICRPDSDWLNTSIRAIANGRNSILD